MTKKCPNCKTDNPDSAGFCQECGTELKSSVNTQKSTESSGGGVTSFWNKQGNGGKAAIVISVCCVGLIILIAIGGMFSPDKTTTTTPAPTTTTPSTTTTPTTSSNSSSSSSSSSASGTQVQVVYSGSWSGSYGDTSGQQSVDGRGSKTIDMSGISRYSICCFPKTRWRKQYFNCKYH